MRSSALSKLQNSGFFVAILAVAALAAIPALAQPDPPDQAGRISIISGAASIQTAGTDDWGQAYPNLPLGPGDRIFTDQNSELEIQVGQSYVRIGPYTDVTLVDVDANLISFGVAQGSVHVHSYGFWQGQSLDVSTPNGDARLGQPGELRADVYPDQGETVFTSYNNGAVISGAGGFWQQLGNWQSLQLVGTNPVYPQWLQPNGADPLDQWSQQRDQQIVNAMSYRYVSPEMPGAADLDGYGDWTPDSDYGPIWFPRNVAADWAPYHYGHWINREPWGWVWVEDESWGYTPFHYGRWVNYRGRWGWVPGPREVHPVWSPALVVFAGGGGVGVSAWFPLGPGEPYRPWYPCSPRYIDQVNITNIHESRIVHVQTTYVNIVNVRNVTNITYVNRTIGVTAMRQDDFAAGRSARQAAVQVDRRQFDRVQVVDRPAPVTMQSIVSRPVAHPVQVRVSKPMFINQQGMQITAKPGERPQAPPVRQVQVQNIQTPPGRTVVAPPPGARYQNAGGNQPGQNNQQGRPMPPTQDRGGHFANPQQPNNYGQQPVNNGNGQQPNNNGYQQRPNQPANNQNQNQGFRPQGGPIPAPPNKMQGEQQPNNNGQQPANNNQNQGFRPQGGPIPAPPNKMQGEQQRQPGNNNLPPTNTPAQQNYRQDFGPVQPNKHQNDVVPNQPPANNPPQARPNPQQPRPDQGNPDRRQEFGPPQPNRPNAQPQPQPNRNNNANNNSNNNRDNGKNNKDNKDNKKDDKKKPN